MNKLVNKYPVLDAGFVAGVSFSVSDADIKDIQETMLNEFDPRLLELPQATLIINAPLFFYAWILEHRFSVIKTKRAYEARAYKPSVADVQGPDLSISAAISQDISATTEALLINPRAYQHDGCDKFVAQVITPISVYNEAVVGGSLDKWIRLVTTEGLPKPLEAYRRAIHETLVAEWPKLPEYMDQVSQWHERRRKKSE